MKSEMRLTFAAEFAETGTNACADCFVPLFLLLIWWGVNLIWGVCCRNWKRNDW